MERAKDAPPRERSGGGDGEGRDRRGGRPRGRDRGPRRDD